MDLENLRRTPLFSAHQKLDGRLVPFAGYALPVQYRGVKQEHLAVRSDAGLFDVCHMGELSLNGPEAGRIVDRVITNDASTLDVGRALYTCACNERGTILDDFIVYHLDRERWLVVCNASNRAKMSAHFRDAALTAQCEFADISDNTALLALQGPKAVAIANRGLEGASLEDLPPFGLRATTLFGVTATVARTGYTGEDGVEIFCPSGEALALWDILLEAGADDGLVAVGLGARDTLRLEARLSLYGNEIDETTHPFEAGLGWTVKLDKSTPFIGREALVQAKAKGASRRLVGFEMTGRGIAREGYDVYPNDEATEAVGRVTSGSPAPSLGKNIGLAYVPRALGKVGSALSIDCRGRRTPAVVVKTPFYRRPGR
ncbi:MAG: glycine cleavage system aminomethyltransferase GcvT [Myxococcota bacterium]